MQRREIAGNPKYFRRHSEGEFDYAPRAMGKRGHSYRVTLISIHPGKKKKLWRGPQERGAHTMERIRRKMEHGGGPISGASEEKPFSPADEGKNQGELRPI